MFAHIIFWRKQTAERKLILMSYVSVKEIAQIWGVTVQTVRRYCSEGKIPGAVQSMHGWQIPASANRPDREEALPVRSIPQLANRLQKQKKKKNYHGLYDYVQIYFTYCSSRMASNRLTMDQIDLIFRKGKVISRFEPVKVSDCIEAMNHNVCIDYIIDHVMDKLDAKFIKKLHYLLMFGSVDDRLEKVTPGEFRTESVTRPGRILPPSHTITSSLRSIILDYESIDEPELSDILNFHVEFEMLMPFRDGNGRIGRLLMFKECLRHGIMPFILEDKNRSIYLEGIKKWSGRRKVLTEVVEKAQERFAREVKYHELHKHGKNFQPEGYQE